MLLVAAAGFALYTWLDDQEKNTSAISPAPVIVSSIPDLMKPESLKIALADLFVTTSTQEDAYRMVSKLHPLAILQFLLFFRAVNDAGYSIILTTGHRSYEYQKKLYDQNHSNAHPDKGSMHQMGFAIDINIRKGSTQLMKATSKQKWINTGIPAIAAAHGIFWGGNYINYADRVHFEYRPRPVKELQALALKQYGSFKPLSTNYITLS